MNQNLKANRARASELSEERYHRARRVTKGQAKKVRLYPPTAFGSKLHNEEKRREISSCPVQLYKRADPSLRKDGKVDQNGYGSSALDNPFMSATADAPKSDTTMLGRSLRHLRDQLQGAVGMFRDLIYQYEDDQSASHARPRLECQTGGYHTPQTSEGAIDPEADASQQLLPAENASKLLRPYGSPHLPNKNSSGQMGDRLHVSTATPPDESSQERVQPHFRRRSQILDYSSTPGNSSLPKMDVSSNTEKGRSCGPFQYARIERNHRRRASRPTTARIDLPPILPRTTSKQAKTHAPLHWNQISEIRHSSFQDDSIDGAELDEKPTLDNRVQAADRFEEIFNLESSRSSKHESLPGRSSHIGLNGRGFVETEMSVPPKLGHHPQHLPVARDWRTSRKRLAAGIACANTALIGLIAGIYAGEVPAIQYVLADLGHSTILGNTCLYAGLAIPPFFFWPLPLLHGRKPYTLMALTVTMCLQIPQGVAVSVDRTPNTAYRAILLASRTISGFALGFVNINLQATLLDVFGASLQTSNPHHEALDPFDVRRHGGGMGIWLGLWSWCYIGSISFGFFIGTLIVQSGSVAWGFWMASLVTMFVLLINIIGPEVRQSAYGQTRAKVLGDIGGVQRIPRGEVKMHIHGTRPHWWGEEVKAGVVLCWKMLGQPGFAVLAVYSGWVYAHFTLVLMLLGALTSRSYRFRPVQVGLCVLALGLGALLASPFQKASLFSRARHHGQRTDSMTVQAQPTGSSHLLRQSLYAILLPFAGIGYVFSSKGSSVSIVLPTLFAACIGFLSNLAVAECHGILMETFDTSDLQAGMTGRPHHGAKRRERHWRTNFSCYPRISAGIAVSQSFGFCFAAIATTVGSHAQRHLGAMQATAAFSAILLALTFLLIVVSIRCRAVQMIPDAPTTIEYLARTNTDWEPVVLGRPSGTRRKISILESGFLTRWSEIRSRNRLTTRPET